MGRLKAGRPRERHLKIKKEKLSEIDGKQDYSKLEKIVLAEKGQTPLGDSEAYVPRFCPISFNDFKKTLKLINPNLILEWNNLVGGHVVRFTYPLSVSRTLENADSGLKKQELGKKFVTAVGKAKVKTLMAHSEKESFTDEFGATHQQYKSKGWEQALDDVMEFLISYEIPFNIPNQMQNIIKG